MARVFVDVSAFSASWFKDVVLPELTNNGNVRFAYTRQEKLVEEQEKAYKVGQFHKLMADKGKLDTAPAAAVNVHIPMLEALPQWTKGNGCDDPHIFSIVFELPSQYVFSTDLRMAKCRGCINRVIDNRFCAFRVISQIAAYKKHRHKILHK